MTLDQLAHAIRNSDLFTAVRQSAIFYPSVLATHLSCIAIFGGMILVTNLRLMGLAFRSTPLGAMIHSLRIWKRIGFVIMISCGILLAGSKLDKYYTNPFLQLKLVLLCAMFIHGFVFRRVYTHPEEFSALPARAKIAGAISLILWLSIMTCGRWIAYYDAPDAIARLIMP